MNAILIIDLEVWIMAVGIADDLKHPCGAIPLCRLVKERQVDSYRDRRVGQLQVVRLIFLMVGVGDEHRRQPVEADHAIRLGIDDLGAFVGKLQAFMVSLMMVQRPRNQKTQPKILEQHIDAAHERAEP